MRRVCLVALLALAACHRQPSEQADPAPHSVTPAAPSKPPPGNTPPAASVSALPAAPDGSSAVELVSAEEKTPDAASAVLHRYYALISARDYPAAYRLWSGDGAASGKSEAEFARGFADTATSAVRVLGPGESDGAAGSIFINLPVEVVARSTAGAIRRYAGHYILRRVNDVPGATAGQLRWHIASASLRPDTRDG